MKGFDARWQDFPAFVLGVTREIWEDRGIATLRQSYASDIVVRSPGSVAVGNEAIIAATLATLAEFPDRTLLGEDVIWSGTPDDGMLSSHRILSTATHSGDGVYGCATGKRLRYRIVADCFARDGKISDEWLVRDQGAIVRQLGQAPSDYARDLISREGGPDRCVAPLTAATDRAGPYQGRGNQDPWGQRYADLLQRIMAADLAAIPSEYDRGCQLEHPGGLTGHGPADADRFWIGLRAALPTATFTLHHVIGRQDPMLSPRAAVRWTLEGVHSGWGMFGRPTGAPLYVLGLSHAEFGPAGVRREWVLLDETAIWKQIHLHTGLHDAG